MASHFFNSIKATPSAREADMRAGAVYLSDIVYNGPLQRQCCLRYHFFSTI